MGVERNIVAVICTSTSELKVVTGYHEHSFIIPVTSEQLCDEREKTPVRNTVVLENYALFNLAEKPTDCLTDGVLTAKIGRSKQCSYVAFPIKVIYKRLNRNYLLFIFWISWAWTINGKKT